MAKVSRPTKEAVLLEAGYKCANPVCRNVLALETHHIIWLRQGGPNTVDNLIALCGHCHNMHTAGHIPASAIRAWKGLLVSLSNPSRASVDLLLVLYGEERQASPKPFRFTGDGLGTLAPLLTSGLVRIASWHSGSSSWGGGTPSFEVRLTDRGTHLVEAWRKGDPDEIRKVLQQPRSILSD